MITITNYARGYDDGFTRTTAEYRHRNADTILDAIDKIDVQAGETYSCGVGAGTLNALEELLFTLEGP